MINSSEENTIKKFFADVKKTASCALCLQMLNDAVLTKCGHQFCHTCITSHCSSEKKCCPLCKGAVSKRMVVDNKKMKNIFSSLFTVVKDLSEESGVELEELVNLNHNNIDNIKSQNSSKTELPRKLSRGKKSLTVETPEANLKVQEWLVNVDPLTNNNNDDDQTSTVTDKTLEQDDSKNKRKGFFPSRASQSATSTKVKATGLKRGRPKRSTEASISQVSDNGSEMNIDENLNDPYEMIAQEKPSSKRSRSKKSTENLTQGSKSRKEALKFCSPTDGNRKISCSSDGSKETEPLILPLRTDSQLSAGKISIETAPIDSENIKTAGLKPGRPKENSQSSTAETSIGQAPDTGTICSPFDGIEKIGDPSSDGSKTTEPLILPSWINSERSAKKNAIGMASFDLKDRSPVKSGGELVPTLNEIVAPVCVSGDSSSLPNSTGSGAFPAVPAVPKPGEVRQSPHQRLTFSMESKTQDLLELGAPLKDTDYTQNQFEMSAVKKKVTFRRIGRLSLNRAAPRRRPIVFKQLGKLDVVSSARCIPLADISNSTLKEHSSTQTRPVVSRPFSTQTEFKSFRSVETQIEAGELLMSTTESLPLNSMDFLQSTNPSSEKKEKTSAPVKRNREAAMDDGDEESNSKRQRSVLVPQQTDCIAPKTSTVNEDVGSVTPNKTRVPESDSESDDIFLATPTSQKNLSRIAEVNKPKVFICSGLPRSQIKSVEELVRQHGSELLPAYNETVTHVIVRVDEEKSAERTLKFLYGVAARKWIVSIDWVNQCLKEKRFVKEEPYEVLDMDGENGPWRARQTTKLLFQDFEFCCVEPFTDVTVQQLRQLLELCGALTVDHPANLTKSRRFSLIVMQADSISDQRKADVYNDRYKVITVSREWVLDCIASYQLYPLRTQIIGKIDLAALTKMGFAHLLD